MLRIFAFLAILLPALACAQRGLNDGIVWRPYKSGTDSRITEARTTVIQNQGALDNYYRLNTGQNGPTDINFNNYLVLAVNLGQRNSGGYSVLFRNVERSGPSEITIAYQENKPPAGSVTASVMTSPYAIVTVERANAVGTFKWVKTEGSGNGIINLLSWRTYQCDTMNGGNSERTFVIRSQRDFQSYWGAVGSGTTPTDVDFNREMLVAIHLGPRPTTGYAVMFDHFEPVNGGFLLCYLEQAPSEGQHVNSVRTSPYVIVRVPLLAGSLGFNKRVWRSDGN